MQSSDDCTIIPLDLGWLGSHFDYIPYMVDLLWASSKPRLEASSYGTGVTLGVRFYCGRNSAALPWTKPNHTWHPLLRFYSP